MPEGTDKADLILNVTQEVANELLLIAQVRDLSVRLSQVEIAVAKLTALLLLTKK